MSEEKGPRGFLGILDAASILECSPERVEELIEKDQLKAIRRDEGDTLIPLPALHAYLAKGSGEMREVTIIKQDNIPSLAEAISAFKDTYSQTPESWLDSWIGEEIEDTAENMSITIHATAIIAEQYMI